jgi:hypothetical protein
VTPFFDWPCVLVAVLLSAVGCGNPALPWPASPLIAPLKAAPLKPMTREQALERIAGHYAHFDIVAYEEPLRGAPMRSFVVSYGFTDFRRDGDELVEVDRFCHAEHRIAMSFDPCLSSLASIIQRASDGSDYRPLYNLRASAALSSNG